MPTWGEVLNELVDGAETNGGNPDFDGTRRKYLAALQNHTQRDTIIYYSDWLAGGSPGTSITLEDMQGMMEVVRGLHGPDLDIILHSPGGSPEATASIVRYLREKFAGEIRAFVPLAAMSAGTMWALSADRVVMGRHSQLGPIDPQILDPASGRFVPARAIVEQFDQAKSECAEDPASLSAWLPLLQQYAPGLLALCEDAETVAKRLVREWLTRYMFTDLPNAGSAASDAADFFADYKHHRSHSLPIDRDLARSKGIVVDDLEEDSLLQEAVLSVHHAAVLSLQGPAVKIVENHLGRAFVKTQPTMPMPLAVSPQPPVAS